MDDKVWKWTKEQDAVLLGMLRVGKKNNYGKIAKALSEEFNAPITGPMCSNRATLLRNLKREEIKRAKEKEVAEKKAEIALQKLLKQEKDKKSKVEPYTPKRIKPPPGALYLRFSQLSDGMCKFELGPVDIPPEKYRFCGLQSVHGSYCSYHCKVIYSTAKPSLPRRKRIW